MPGDSTWSPTRPFSSVKELSHPHRARYHAYVRVLPSRLSPTSLSFATFGCPAHSVCIRDVKEAFSVRPRFPESFEYLVLDVQDSEEQNLIRLFPTFVWWLADDLGLMFRVILGPNNS
jgi:hypothetical protein